MNDLTPLAAAAPIEATLAAAPPAVQDLRRLLRSDDRSLSCTGLTQALRWHSLDELYPYSGIFGALYTKVWKDLENDASAACLLACEPAILSELRLIWQRGDTEALRAALEQTRIKMSATNFTLCGGVLDDV